MRWKTSLGTAQDSTNPLGNVGIEPVKNTSQQKREVMFLSNPTGAPLSGAKVISMLQNCSVLGIIHRAAHGGEKA
jgi:hypothetical protein